MDRKILCLDTNVIIEIFKNNRDVIQKLEGWPFYVGTTSINAMELLTNASERKREIYREFLAGLLILDFDYRAAEIASEIIRDLRRKGMIMEIRDIMIASVCISKSVPLFTLDEDFHRLTDYGLLLF